MEKSSVSLTLKQSVAKGGGVGWEMNVLAVEGCSDEVLKDLADKAVKVAEHLLKKQILGETNARPD